MVAPTPALPSRYRPAGNPRRLHQDLGALDSSGCRHPPDTETHREANRTPFEWSNPTHRAHPPHTTRPDRAGSAGIRLRSSALRPSHSPSGDCGSIQSIFLLPVSVAKGTPSRNAIRVEAVAETRSPRQTTPVRFSGSAALKVTMAPSTGARRTRRRVSTASGSAYCSPVKPATNRPPRISPRASRRRNSRRRSRHGTVIDSRASSGLNTTP